ncbi:MAG TPA: hypothetical protein VJA21_13345 [Verrucomicrobiae bacterium]
MRFSGSGWAAVLFGAQLALAGVAQAEADLAAARRAEQREDWTAALLEYESVYDSTCTDEATRAELRRKFAKLRAKVPANSDPAKAGVWKVKAFAFRELDFSWKDKQGKDHHAQYRYREDELDRLRRGMAGFAGRVWDFTSGNLRIDWDLKIIDTPLKQLDGEDSFWPGPDACMPHLAGLERGDMDTVMVFVKVFGDAAKGEASDEVPQMLLGGAIGISDPLTKGATYIGFNWGTGTADNEPDGEPMLHEWLHSAQWGLEDFQGYPRGLMFTSDGGRMEGETGGDACYRRQPSETSWMRFYSHLMRDHVTRRMWRELTLRHPPENVWLKEYPVAPYVDAAQAHCPWPKMSHYLQPWRSYLETRSGHEFLNGIGINLHIPADTEELAIRLLAETGFKTFRIEIGWGEMNWHETALNNEERFRRKLALCARYGIRPTLLLNAHQGVPCPVLFFERELVADAPRGATTVRLNSVKDLVVGRSGFNGLSDYWAAEALITRVDAARNEVTLSKPLPKALKAGRVAMATLKYAPLHPAETPEFDETAAGWVCHALHVCRLAEEAGLKEFDVEIWNELTFGTHFLNINDYYDPEHPKVSKAQPDFLRKGGRCWELARRTAEAVKQQHPKTRVVWGFSNTTFFHCPVPELPPGIDGQSYHPYGTGTRKINGKQERPDQSPVEGYVPAYTLRMPEGWAPTFIQTECLIRHLAKYARLKTTAPGAQRFHHYITEHGVLPPECGITNEQGAWDLKALCATRSFALWLNKGIDALHYFDAYEDKATSFGVLPLDLKQLANDARFADVATPPMRAISNLVGAFQGSVPLQETDPLDVEATALGPQTKVFEGDATHPPLWHREVLAVLPFQVNPDKHAVILYVMTRDVTQPFGARKFRLKFQGVKGHEVKGVDVLTGKDFEVQVKEADGASLVMMVEVSDKPAVVTIGK